MTQAKHRLDILAITLLLILCISWGGQQVAVKLIIDEVPPLMQATIRSMGAMVLVAVWCRWRGRSPIIWDGTLWWGVGAGVLFSLEFLLVYWGLTYTSASRAVIFIYLSPFVVAIGSQWLIPEESLNRTQFLGLGLAFFGIVIAFGESSTRPSHQMLVGDLMLTLSAVFWGATTLLIKVSPLAHIEASRTLLYQLAVSAMILPLASLFLDEPMVTSLSSTALWSLLYQTIWVAAVTYLVWYWLVTHYPACQLSSFTFLAPLFGVLAGGWILDEPLTTALLAALVLVGSGLYLVNRSKSPQ
ncbi:DMT family transporter [Magnetococcus sp. PR-3]|uniref:DMT family transporter n=1 Tax=Magnetococcus sp. PR-3 TaxID=3120355 RepID=UPI002FCE5EED